VNRAQRRVVAKRYPAHMRKDVAALLKVGGVRDALSVTRSANPAPEPVPVQGWLRRALQWIKQLFSTEGRS